MDRDRMQRRFTPAEERAIESRAAKLEEEFVANLYLDIARLERGELL